MVLMRGSVCLLLALLLAGCAGSPPRFETAQVRDGLTPQSVIEGEQVFQGETVLWGGRIIETHNEAQRTVLEVLSYPLDGDQRPNTDRNAGARFLASYDGFLDPADYEAGRLVTVKGTVSGTRSGQVGEVELAWPLVDARDIELWPERERGYGDPGSPRVNFGFGIILGN
jgi:outer membrane lipoprotein